MATPRGRSRRCGRRWRRCGAGSNWSTVQGQQAAPDYSPTLGKMEQALQAIAERLEAVRRQPALTLTPASFRTEIDAVSRAAASNVSRPFTDAVHQIQSVARDLTALVGRVHERREQRTWLLTAGVLGLVAGVGLWYVAARLLQGSAGDWIAASLIGGNRWQAGETLMQESSPESWAGGRKECSRAGTLTSPAARRPGRAAESMSEATLRSQRYQHDT
jgi:Family of unknown function (DUF6118)